MKTYKSFDEINRDLRQLSLERQIAFEELKIVKNDFNDFIKPANMLNSVFKFVSKYGVLLLIKKFLK